MPKYFMNENQFHLLCIFFLDFFLFPSLIFSIEKSIFWLIFIIAQQNTQTERFLYSPRKINFYSILWYSTIFFQYFPSFFFTWGEKSNFLINLLSPRSFDFISIITPIHIQFASNTKRNYKFFRITNNNWIKFLQFSFKCQILIPEIHKKYFFLDFFREQSVNSSKKITKMKTKKRM